MNDPEGFVTAVAVLILIAILVVIYAVVVPKVYNECRDKGFSRTYCAFQVTR